ncbi:TolC family outer membrane protein [Aurantiacibacter suaedae]|uniref:TolC family outer membrane protein n=1 Tax=Aurantiacibacter suaedae TaxID=2545755 RepID=UPI0010F49BB6|nr:TolC family outer membrane protein [Aurantiacibacter suaedae]
MQPRSAIVVLLASACLIASPAQADTLKDALASAYAENPTLEAARAQLRATDENVVIQRASGLPSASASGTYTEYLKQNSTNFISPDRAVNAGVDLAVPLYQGGAVRNGVLAAETRVEAGRADLRGTESAVFSQVVAAYMDVIRNEAIVGLSANNVEVLEVNYQATSDRFEIGDLTRTDVAQSDARLALARSNLQSAEANLITARERYVELVGNAPGELAPPPPLPGLPSDVDTAVQIALENNPDLIAALERAQASRYDIDVAGAGRLPTLEAFGTGGYQNYLGTLSDPNTSEASTTAQAGLRLRLPLFQGGRVSARERQAQANSQAALEQVVATERAIIAQVRGAYSSWRAASAIVRSSQNAVDAAALSLEGVRAENTVGNRTILDILNAQQELLNAQVELVTARRNAYVAGFTLLAAMGRAEARDLGLADYGPLYDPVVNYNRVRGNVWDWSREEDPVTQSIRTVDIPAQDAEIPETTGPEQ